MLTQTEITEAAIRLENGKLTGTDQETLLSVFRLYLKNKISGFQNLQQKLAEAEDSANSQIASKLAALLNQFEISGFDLSEIEGGRSGLKTDEKGSLVLKIRFALALLGYDLPESFAGNITNGTENADMFGGGILIGSMTVDSKPDW